MAHLFDDLVLQVPWKDQNVVGPSSVDFFHRTDRYVHSGWIWAVLIGIAVRREFKEVGADTAVVKQRVALAGCAVTANSFPFALGCDEERKQFSLGLPNLLGKRTVAVEALQTEPIFQLDKID